MDLKRALPLKHKRLLRGVCLQVRGLQCRLPRTLVVRPCSDSAFLCTPPATNRKQEARESYWGQESNTFPLSKKVQWSKQKVTEPLAKLSNSETPPMRLFCSSWKYPNRLMAPLRIADSQILVLECSIILISL